jgi:hypothetical protein
MRKKYTISGVQSILRSHLFEFMMMMMILLLLRRRRREHSYLFKTKELVYKGFG